MHTLVRRLVIAATLVATLAPAALAGGANAKVEGPAEDGRYTVRTYACSDPTNLHVTAWAEGLVDGKRQTVPIKIEMTRAKGVYSFKLPTDAVFSSCGPARPWPGTARRSRNRNVSSSVRMCAPSTSASAMRSWPEGGRWAIRMALGNQGHAPVIVTALDDRGAVKANKLIWEGDGKKECVAILNGEGC